MAKIHRQTKSQQKSAISPAMIAVVVVASILLVGGLIYLGYQSQQAGPAADMSQFPALGDPNAPVTMIEYSDYG
jgi:hypothetical protein